MMFSRSRKYKQQLDTKVDMTPMLDIVFIILIFFIVTAVFLTEKGIDLTQSNDGGDPPRESAIGVYVFADGSASVNGRLTDVQAVPARVQILRVDNPGAAVSIRAEHETAFKNLVYLEDQFEIADIPTNIRVEPDL